MYWFVCINPLIGRKDGVKGNECGGGAPHEHHEVGGSERPGKLRVSIDRRRRDYARQVVAQGAEDGAERGSYEEIAGIVYAKIQTGVAVQYRPNEDEDCGTPRAQEKRAEGGQCERIGCMAGWEAVGTAPIVVHNHGKSREGIVEVGRTQTGYCRAQQMAAEFL